MSVSASYLLDWRVPSVATCLEQAASDLQCYLRRGSLASSKFYHLAALSLEPASNTDLAMTGMCAGGTAVEELNVWILKFKSGGAYPCSQVLVDHIA